MMSLISDVYQRQKSSRKVSQVMNNLKANEGGNKGSIEIRKARRGVDGRRKFDSCLERTKVSKLSKKKSKYKNNKA